MKLLRVLVLAVFTAGCNALTVEQSLVAPRRVEMVRNPFWVYFSKATVPAEESLKQMQLPELGEEVNAFIAQSSETVSWFSHALRTRLAPLTQDLIDKNSREARQMRGRLEKDMATITNRLKPHTQDLLSGLQTQVEELQREAATFTESLNPESLKATFIQKSQAMNRDLQAQMGPYTEDMRQKMEKSFEDFQRSLVSMSQDLEAQFNQKTRDLQQSFAPYEEELREKIDLEAQNMKEQLETLWESFIKNIQ